MSEIVRTGYDLPMSEKDDIFDPRTNESDGDQGTPAELIDTPQNLPGDQPEDDRPPSRIKATGRD